MNFSAIPRESFVGKLLRFPLKLLPSKLTMPIMQGPMRGMRWIIGSGDHGYWLGSYELEFQHRFAKIVQPRDIVLDIGAHVGYYTLLASKLVGTHGHVYSFEPLPRNAEYIERHIRLNRLQNVTFSQIAISSHSGTASFGGGVSSSTGRLSKDGDLEVRTSTLDELIDSDTIETPQIIKIDVEGAERSVLEGAKLVLQKHHPILFLATHGPEAHRDCLDLLHSLGYSLEPMNANELKNASEILALPRAED
jgi:FkbM family methyltransferase